MDNTSHLLTIKKEKFIFLIISISILFPTFPSIFPGYTGFHFALAISLSLIFFYIASYRDSFKHNGTNLISATYFCFFLILTIISAFREVIFGNANTSDVFEIARPIYIIIYYYFFRLSSLHPTRLTESFKRALIFCSIFFIFFALFEVFGGKAGSLVSFFLYKREYKEIISDKAVGSFGITYHFAYFMLIPLFYYLISYIREGRLFHFCLFILSLISILLSQSRTLYLAVTSGFLLLFFCGFIYKDNSWKRWLSLNLLLLISVSIISFNYWEQLIEIFGYAYNGLSALLRNGIDFSGQGDGSANIRVSQLVWVLENIDMIPAIGSGLGNKEVLLESLYSLYLYRYGAIFLLSFLIFTLVLSLQSYKLGNHFKYINKSLSTFFYSLFFFYALSPIALLSSASQDSSRLSLVFYGAAALIFLNKHYIKKSALQNARNPHEF